ncbi:MAG TPA: hypothetical protein PLR25_06005 [Planctomycetaceae bacterium]|nr:hypothetical protein [Planctomycetaceae bacterium]
MNYVLRLEELQVAAVTLSSNKATDTQLKTLSSASLNKAPTTASRCCLTYCIIQPDFGALFRQPKLVDPDGRGS